MIDSISVKEAFGSEWTDVNNHIDIGSYPGVYRGYNLEFKDSCNDIDYSDMILTPGELDYNNPAFSQEFESRRNTGYIFTDRAVFRGYFTGDYDQDTDTFKLLSNEGFTEFYDQVMSGGDTYDSNSIL